MRKVIVSVYTTLNGVMSPLDWRFPLKARTAGNTLATSCSGPMRS